MRFPDVTEVSRRLKPLAVPSVFPSPEVVEIDRKIFKFNSFDTCSSEIMSTICFTTEGQQSVNKKYIPGILKRKRTTSPEPGSAAALDKCTIIRRMEKVIPGTTVSTTEVPQINCKSLNL